LGKDLKPTVEGIRRAASEFGSIAHLAWAMGVPQTDFSAWYKGEKEMPVEKYEQMLLIVADWKARAR
jgi:hypothetical protein